MSHLMHTLTFGLLCCLLLAACAPQTPAPLPLASAMPVPTMAILRIATQTPVLSTSPTSLLVTDSVTIPTCAEDGTGDTRAFNELLESLAPSVYEMDSYRYRTLYRYLEGDRYADGELSVEVEGAHNGLLSSPAESILTFGSQSYEHSNVVVTDLHSGARTETIVTEDGFWVREEDNMGWVAFDPATPADLSNLAEMFSPQVILFMVGGGGSLAPGARADTPAMMQVETLDGREVTHRCWILPTYEDFDFNAYLIHWENTYTFLSDAQIHLWTTEDDTQLVRMALTAKHGEERQGLSDYAEEDEYTQHDPPRDFLLWMEISDVNTPVEIEPPPLDQIALTIPGERNPAADLSTPYNDLPLPAGAEKVGVFGDEVEGWPPERMSTTPREYRWLDYTIRNEGVLDEYFGPGWDQIPADRRAVYEAEMDLPEAAAFYLDEMSRRGWSLKEKFYQLGLPVLYLFFERDGVTFPIILETNKAGTTSISTILPPADEALETILSGWTTYTTQNSDLSNDSIRAIAFDAQGRTWIGTYDGLTIFDGEAWTIEKSGQRVNALATDPQGRVWVGIEEQLSVFDGKAWQIYDAPYQIAAVAMDQSGRVWLGTGKAGVSLFDGKAFTNYSPGEIGIPDGHSVDGIASDLQNRIWIGTDGGGVYVFDGKVWNTVLKAKSPPNTTYMNYAVEDIVVDQEGRVWIGTQEGLSVFNGKDWMTYTPEDSDMPSQWVQALAIDAYDRVWVGGSYGAVSVLETDGTWNTYTPIQSAATSYAMNALSIDPGGRIWVGNDEGLNVFTPPIPASKNPRVLHEPSPLQLTPTPMPTPPISLPTPGPGWTTYTTENSGLSDNWVTALAIDGQDQIWVGTNHGVNVIRPTGEWTNDQVVDSGLLDDMVNALVIDGKDQIWVGTESSGLTVLASNGTWKTYIPENSELAHERVDELLVDNQGRVWIANLCGGSCYAINMLPPDGKWSTYTPENSGMADAPIYALASDGQSQVWIGYYGGLSVLAPSGEWTNYTNTDLGLTGDHTFVTALSVDDQGKVWIGSYGNGLVVLAPDGSRTAYTTANSDLASDDIYALLVDDVGRVWVQTDEGISVLSPDSSWESYPYPDPVLVNNNASGLAMDRYGRLWIGTSAGLSVIVPNTP
jgi:ligand-binding sensor domain-containing protein